MVPRVAMQALLKGATKKIRCFVLAKEIKGGSIRGKKGWPSWSVCSVFIAEEGAKDDTTTGSF